MVCIVIALRLEGSAGCISFLACCHAAIILVHFCLHYKFHPDNLCNRQKGDVMHFCRSVAHDICHGLPICKTTQGHEQGIPLSIWKIIVRHLFHLLRHSGTNERAPLCTRDCQTAVLLVAFQSGSRKNHQRGVSFQYFLVTFMY